MGMALQGTIEKISILHLFCNIRKMSICVLQLLKDDKVVRLLDKIFIKLLSDVSIVD